MQITDLHRHNIDHLTIPSSKGKGQLRRVEDVFDCWFESGSMPYGQLHYPFENSDFFEDSFPADFVAEGAALSQSLRKARVHCCECAMVYENGLRLVPATL